MALHAGGHAPRHANPPTSGFASLFPPKRPLKKLIAGALIARTAFWQRWGRPRVLVLEMATQERSAVPCIGEGGVRFCGSIHKGRGGEKGKNGGSGGGDDGGTGAGYGQ